MVMNQLDKYCPLTSHTCRSDCSFYNMASDECLLANCAKKYSHEDETVPVTRTVLNESSTLEV